MKAFRWIAKATLAIIDDLLYIGGVICIAIGAFMIVPWAGWMVIGSGAIAMSLIISRKG